MSADARPVVPRAGRLRPLSLGEVEIVGGSWAQRQHVNSAATLAHCQGWMERLEWVANFERATDGTIAGNHHGMMFADSDVYKLMEAMAWEVGRSGSEDADGRIRGLTEIIGAAQESDGYLNTVFGRPGQEPRYSNLEWGHELYNFGHLLQAGVARSRTTGDDRFVEITRRAADHVCATFGPGGIERVGGHPEIELGLVEMARVTGEQRYLDQAELFVERRGRGTLGEIGFGQAYFQDDMPVREATVFRGHAVRALYLAAGVVDVAVETGDDDLLASVISQWEATIARRTYLTGGMGSHHTGEAFGDDFVLPPDRAYSETCAGIASVMLAWRLLLATGEPRFADLIERTLYNVIATSPAPDGRSFFYANPLHQRVPGKYPDPDVESKRASSSLREPWFLVACCPTNVARTLASLAAYLATVDTGGIQIHQFVESRIGTTLDDGRRVGVEVSTDYPSGGAVTVRITESDQRPWALTLRIPNWATGATLTDPSGDRRAAGPGNVVVEWPFGVGDEVTLTVPIGPRWTRPDPRIDAIRGCVAVERGPIVMCAESVDLADGRHVDVLRVDPSVPPRDEDGAVLVNARLVEPPDQPWPYGEESGTGTGEADSGPVDIPLTPYHSWANRGPSTMRVWIPVTNS
ncbi:MAG TPA: beta-L-arabinofuranosidase domain-containing protein [Ilumatobacteraceae bacterium]|nr:beta-L-arabinofuranosidase domain-containing protein [Ilumatobacteraceae bacterium]